MNSPHDKLSAKSVDHRWPRLGAPIDQDAGPEVANVVTSTQPIDPQSDDAEVDDPQKLGWEAGWTAGHAEGLAAAQRERNAEQQRVIAALADLNSVTCGLDTALCQAIVTSVERITREVVGAELGGSAAAVTRLAEAALAELRASVAEVALEVAPEDVATVRTVHPEFAVRGAEDVVAPGFRLVWGSDSLHYDPHELINAALDNLAQAARGMEERP